jgi:hypothetical protein
MSQIVLYFPGHSQNCVENDGFGAEVILTTVREYKTVCNVMKWYGSEMGAYHTEFDFSSGDHNCIIRVDMFEAWESLKVVDDNPTPEVIAAIEKFASHRFWDVLNEWVSEKQEQRKKQKLEEHNKKMLI